jgi:hypothetical protein
VVSTKVRLEIISHQERREGERLSQFPESQPSVHNFHLRLSEPINGESEQRANAVFTLPSAMVSLHADKSHHAGGYRAEFHRSAVGLN